ncbi:MAG: hypothetical protein JRN20_06100 [Nitrososphaerota archaeon]|nr:hypothetical protein [Nitrososphaerota archaeon]
MCGQAGKSVFPKQNFTAVFVGITTTIDQARTCIISNGISLPVDINAIEPIAIGALLLIILLWSPKGLVKEKRDHKQVEARSLLREDYKVKGSSHSAANY